MKKILYIIATMAMLSASLFSASVAMADIGTYMGKFRAANDTMMAFDRDYRKIGDLKNIIAKLDTDLGNIANDINNPKHPVPLAIRKDVYNKMKADRNRAVVDRAQTVDSLRPTQNKIAFLVNDYKTYANSELSQLKNPMDIMRMTAERDGTVKNGQRIASTPVF